MAIRGYPNDEKHPVVYHQKGIIFGLWTPQKKLCFFLVELEEAMILAGHLDAAFSLFPPSAEWDDDPFLDLDIFGMY